MKFNESLLKSKIKENLKGIENNLDREGKATAIAEALNFFDSKRDWVTKINRDEIISLITNSPSQDVLCESIIDKVNATPFSKSLKESKKKKESKKLNESLKKKTLKEHKKLSEDIDRYDPDFDVCCSNIADALDGGWWHGITESERKWGLVVNGGDGEQFSPLFADVISYECSYPVRDGEFEISGLDCWVNKSTFHYADWNDEDDVEQIRRDLLGVGCDNEEITKFISGEVEEIEFYIDFYIDIDDLEDYDFDESLKEGNKALDKGKMITNSKGISYYQKGNKYYSNTGWLEKEITKDEFDKNVEQAFKEVDESLDDTQKLIDNAKKFAKENGKDVKVTGLVNSNECAISTFPEDFNEMVKLFNTKFDVYDEDSELERFKIKAKSTNESLNEEVTGMAKEFIKELKEFKQFQIDRIKEQNGYDYDDVDIDVGGQDYEDCVDELLDIAQFYDREFDNLTHTIEAKVKDCVEQNMSIFEIVDYLIKDCKSEFNESLKEHISSKDLKDNDILDILGIEEEQRKVKNVGSYIKQYRQLLDKGYDEPKFEIYLKGDDAYYKKLGKVVDNSKDLVVIDTNSKEENLKEGYYDYMDKDYAYILDKDVDVYDIKQFVLNDTNNEFRTHYSDEFALITCPNGKGCVVDYEAVGQDFDTLDSEIEFGIEENKDSEYTDENGKTHKTIRIFASHILTTTPKEVMEKAPKKTMKYRDFFRKYKYNDRCADNFAELVSYIKKNGGLQENLKESYSIEQLASGETIDDYKDNCKKYNIKITQLDGNNIKLEGRKEDLINYYKEVVGVSEDMVDLKESCHSKKKKTLKEGYLGQTLEDFFYDCVDPEVIGTVSLWGDNDEIYNGDYDGAMDEYGSNEFIEFDCGMDKVVINVDTSEEYQVTDYFIDVQDFVDCFNGDEIEVYDINTGETLFSGDRYDLPDDVAEKIFVSFDAPKFISINIEEDGDRFDDDDDFDESLKEDIEISKADYDKFLSSKCNGKPVFGHKLKNENGKYFWLGSEESLKAAYEYFEPIKEGLGKIQEITKAVDCDGNEFYVKPIWRGDRLAKLVDNDGNQTRVELADIRQFYDLYDQDGEVISRYEDYMDESLKENNNTLKLQNGGFAYISDYNKDQFEKEYVETGKYKKSGVAQSPKGKYTLYTNSVGDTYAVLDENLKEGNNPLYRVVKDPKGNGYCILKRVNEKDKFINDHSKETFATPEEAKKMLDKVNELHFFIDENLKEDTVKQGDKWVNKGNTGETHGEFKTKKEADKQRKAMFVNKKPNAKWGK